MPKIVVPVSGGKDSQACLKLATEEYGPENVRGLFCDTQFEHPLTYTHVQKLEGLYGVQIDRVCQGSVPEKVREYQRFPGPARHCTYTLKIRPSREYYWELTKSQPEGFEVWYGVRQAESAARAKQYKDRVCDEVYWPHEYMPKNFPKGLGKAGVRMRLPIVTWTAEEVMDFVGRENLNPLYSHGFDRVGCFPCLAAGKGYQDRAYAFDAVGAEHDRIVTGLEQELGHHDRYGKSTGDTKGGPGCSICQE
jgi:3'-phosphoadenosine 5'-phosphosulfate sulfotransferase (PAPS reductase)/FAD synthetase